MNQQQNIDDLTQINLHRQWADAMVGEGLFAAVDQ